MPLAVFLIRRPKASYVYDGVGSWPVTDAMRPAWL